MATSGREQSKSICAHCGAPAGRDDVVYGNTSTDPLMVAECSQCGHVVEVDGHRW